MTTTIHIQVPLGTDESLEAAKSAVAALQAVFGDDLFDTPAEKPAAKKAAAPKEDEAPKETAAQKKKRLAAEKKAKEEAEAAAAEEEDASESEEEDSNADDDDADEVEGPTRDDVRAALKDYAALEGKEAAIAILKDHGASSMSELKESKFQAVIDATK